jgi:hypothetical protein
VRIVGKFPHDREQHPLKDILRVAIAEGIYYILHAATLAITSKGKVLAITISTHILERMTVTKKGKEEYKYHLTATTLQIEAGA